MRRCTGLLTLLSGAVADLTAAWLGISTEAGAGAAMTGVANAAPHQPAADTGGNAKQRAKAPAKAKLAAKQPRRTASAAAAAAETAAAAAAATDPDSSDAGAGSPPASGHVFRIPKKPLRPPSPGAIARLAAAEAAQKASAKTAAAAALKAAAAAWRKLGGALSTGTTAADSSPTLPLPAANGHAAASEVDPAAPIVVLSPSPVPGHPGGTGNTNGMLPEDKLDCNHLPPLLPGGGDGADFELLPPGFAADLLDLGAAEFEDLDLGMFMRPHGEPLSHV